MIDNFSIGLTHVLMLYAAWRLFTRVDFDDESGAKKFRFGFPVSSAAPPPAPEDRDA